MTVTHAELAAIDAARIRFPDLDDPAILTILRAERQAIATTTLVRRPVHLIRYYDTLEVMCGADDGMHTTYEEDVTCPDCKDELR